MNTITMIEAFSNLDDDLVEKHFKAKEALKMKKAAKTKSHWLKWSAAVVACLLLVICATFLPQYIPVEYSLNYSYTGENGREMYIAEKNIWVYYVKDGSVERERVKLPCSPKNVFIAWKHLNNIGDDVELVKCEIVSNGQETISYYDYEKVYNYEVGDTFVLNIVVSANLADTVNESEYDEFVSSLKKSISECSNLEFDEINVVLE